MGFIERSRDVVFKAMGFSVGIRYLPKSEIKHMDEPHAVEEDSAMFLIKGEPHHPQWTREVTVDDSMGKERDYREYVVGRIVQPKVVKVFTN